jgi:hypothetical protein
MGFHRWLTADDDPDRPRTLDQCIGCGVVAPDFGEGVVSDHGPLPIGCPGPDATAPWIAHHFDDAGDGAIECDHCTLRIDMHTLPADVDWQCNPGIHEHCPDHADAEPTHVDSDGMVMWSCGCIT